MDDEKILPVEEMVAYEEFTDRVEILRELDAWVKNIQRMASPSREKTGYGSVNANTPK